MLDELHVTEDDVIGWIPQEAKWLQGLRKGEPEVRTMKCEYVEARAAEEKAK
jgi:hypothetical protein